MSRKRIKVKIKNLGTKKGDHPHIILDDIEDNHVSVGLSTKKKKGKSKRAGTNKKLDHDPLGEGKYSHIRRQATIEKRVRYHKERTGTMTEEDHKVAKGYGEKAKAKWLKRKK